MAWMSRLNMAEPAAGYLRVEGSIRSLPRTLPPGLLKAGRLARGDLAANDTDRRVVLTAAILQARTPV